MSRLPYRVASVPLGRFRSSVPDPVRLRRELDGLHRAFGGHVVLYRTRGTSGTSWSDYGVSVSVAGRRIVGRFSPDHPYRPPRFTIDPPLRSKHYYDDGKGMHLCFCRPEEWHPDWTMATALGIVYRFLGLTLQHRVD